MRPGAKKPGGKPRIKAKKPTGRNRSPRPLTYREIFSITKQVAEKHGFGIKSVPEKNEEYLKAERKTNAEIVGHLANSVFSDVGLSAKNRDALRRVISEMTEIVRMAEKPHNAVTELNYLLKKTRMPEAISEAQQGRLNANIGKLDDLARKITIKKEKQIITTEEHVLFWSICSVNNLFKITWGVRK